MVLRGLRGRRQRPSWRTALQLDSGALDALHSAPDSRFGLRLERLSVCVCVLDAVDSAPELPSSASLQPPGEPRPCVYWVPFTAQEA